MTTQEKVEQMLAMLELKIEMVHDLPDAPDKNTIYVLEQKWAYLEGKWVRLG